MLFAAMSFITQVTTSCLALMYQGTLSHVSTYCKLLSNVMEVTLSHARSASSLVAQTHSAETASGSECQTQCLHVYTSSANVSLSELVTV